MNNLVNEQELPKDSSGDVWLLVLKDMEDRRKIGIEKYGKPLQPFNGRNALVDAYQEVLDLAVYLRQAIEEKNKQSIPNHGPCGKCGESVLHVYPWFIQMDGKLIAFHDECAREALFKQ